MSDLRDRLRAAERDRAVRRAARPARGIPPALAPGRRRRRTARRVRLGGLLCAGALGVGMALHAGVGADVAPPARAALSAAPERCEAPSEPALDATPPAVAAAPAALIEAPAFAEMTPVDQTPASADEALEPAMVKQLAEPSAGELHYQLGLTAQRAGRGAEAIHQLRAALEAEPEHALARELLAGFEIAAGRAAEAVTLLREGRRIDAARIDFAILEARLLADGGDPAEALEVLDAYAPPLGENAEFHALRAALLYRAGHATHSATLYAELLTLDRRRPRWWMGLALALDGGGRHGAALDAYRQALQLGGLDARTRARLSQRVRELEARS